MPRTQWTENVNVPFGRVVDLLRDKVENPQKYVPSVRFSRILERADSHVLREMYQPYPGDLTIRERITEHEVAGGIDFVFEYVDNPTYVGTFHNTAVRAGDGVELTYVMDWTPRPGVSDPIPSGVAEAMVRDGVQHLKRLAEAAAVGHGQGGREVIDGDDRDA
ncbi:SRPBCC family protein [Qaidamihabitans albus]|uniref:SRPBCC family protein n=1 Tax=Qaidamihabitans albus TaxID=2795733 RepID=UPI0018F276F6|nr:SRPBCC family protein [Qaidamihabitans albus]